MQGEEDPGAMFRWVGTSHICRHWTVSPLSWLEELLSELAVSGRTAWIVGHIPPGKFERFYQFCGEYKGCDTHGGYWGFHWLR